MTAWLVSRNLLPSLLKRRCLQEGTAWHRRSVTHGSKGWVGGNRVEGREVGGIKDLFQGRTADEDNRETAGRKDGYEIWRDIRWSFTKFRAGPNLTANRKLTEFHQFLAWIKWANIILWEYKPFLYPEWACETCFDLLSLSYLSKEEALRLFGNWTHYCSSFTSFHTWKSRRKKCFSRRKKDQ